MSADETLPAAADVEGPHAIIALGYDFAEYFRSMKRMNAAAALMPRHATATYRCRGY